MMSRDAVREQDRPPDLRRRAARGPSSPSRGTPGAPCRASSRRRSRMTLSKTSGFSSMKSAPTAWIVEQVAEVVDRQRLALLAPVAEHRAPVRRRSAPSRSRRRRRSSCSGYLAVNAMRDHAAHRRAVGEHPVDAERVEQPGALVGPALDRVAGQRLGRAAVAGGVEAQQAEVLAHAVVDRVEVRAPEQRPAELQDQRCVLGARELVVQANVADVCERHGSSSRSSVSVTSLHRRPMLYTTEYRDVDRQSYRAAGDAFGRPRRGAPMNPAPGFEVLRASLLDTLIGDLRARFEVDRCTLRLDVPGDIYPVVYESRTDRARSWSATRACPCAASRWSRRCSGEPIRSSSPTRARRRTIPRSWRCSSSTASPPRS